MTEEPLRHPPLRILIGPPIDDWFQTDTWTLLPTERRASVMDLAQSHRRSISNNRHSRTQMNPSNQSGHLQIPNPEGATLNETRSYISQDPSIIENLTSPLATPQDGSLVLPRQCRALVRIEFARDWHGLPGTYRLDQIDSVERKFAPFQEYGLVLYHNRLELTESQDQVAITIRFSNNAKLSVYSSIDVSLAISVEHPGEVNTQIYILVFPTPALARSWYISLHRVMGSVRPTPEQVTVAVPELDTQVQIFISDDAMSVWDLRDAVLNGLSGEASWEGTLQRWRDEHTAGVCWKHFDKLEWISERQSSVHPLRNLDKVVTPQLIEGTHELQIRTVDHNGGIPESSQPLAIEGYALFRSYCLHNEDTPQMLPSGRLKKGRAYYLATFQHHVIYVDASKFSKKLKGTKPPIECIPYTFIESCNRPGFDGHQAYWLNRRDPNTHADLLLWRNADGFLDLREVVSVSAKGVTAWEIELRGGNIIKFEAWDASTRSEWVRRFQQLLTHWRPLLQTEARQLVNYAKLNTTRLGEDGHPETGVNFDVANRRVLANPLLWRICQTDRCSPVLHSGVLFIKDHPHMAFRKVHVILTLDAVHLFEASVSTHYADEEEAVPVDSTSLPPPQKLLHSRISLFGTNPLSLQNCFAYAHYSFDLVDEVDAPPRVFPDLLVACDREPDRTFGIWSSHLAYLWPGPQEAPWWSQMASSIYRSFSCGHAWYWPWRLGRQQGSHSRLICQARSRLERDHWVHAISIAIDYFVQYHQWDKSRGS